MNDDQPNGNPWIKSLLVWGGIFLALLMVVSMFGARGEAGPTIPYSDFRAKVTTDSVASVEISEDRITGKFTNGDSFATVPVPGDTSLTQLLEAHDVKYSGKEAEQGSLLVYILAQTLPFLLIVGIAFFALLLTMVTAIILGMGLPTTAAYLILATVVAPALADLGVPLLTAHMFVFFYGCVSTITPPVALASYVAAGIANADINKVGWTAFSYGITCYVLPFMFFFGSALMMDGPWMDIAQAAVTGLAGVVCLAAFVIGYLDRPLTMPLRGLLLIAGLSLLAQGWISDIAGLTLAVTVIIIGRMRSRHSASLNTD